MTEQNQKLFERFVHLYSEFNLEPAEWAIVKYFKKEWAHMDMLDIGVGMGRTSYVFSAITRSYTGIDYSSRAIDLCRQLIGEEETVRFLHCDARAMSRCLDRKFDFILFSENGIDCGNHEERIKILHEVGNVLKKEGYFFFSSHSLKAPARRLTLPRFNPLLPVRSMYKCGKACVQHLKFKYANRRAYAAKDQGWAILKEDLGDHALAVYYIDPKRQLQQLADAGFRVVQVLDRRGRQIDCRTPREDLWLHYLCGPQLPPMDTENSVVPINSVLP